MRVRRLSGKMLKTLMAMETKPMSKEERRMLLKTF